MKQIICVMLCAFVACASALHSIAATETVDGIRWTYTVVNGKATLGGSSSIRAVPTSTTGTLTIPSSLGGYPVTSIGSSAFSYCSGLTNVAIPDSVTSIGSSAFEGCSGLTGVTIGSGVTSIGDRAFYDCGGLTSVAIPNSVTNIGASAFYNCRGLTSMPIGSGVTSIGEGAFSRCSGLTSVTIPNSVKCIGSDAFSGCKDSIFDTTTIPQVRLLDGWVVERYSNISGHLDLNGVRGICDNAFSFCSGLTSVTIPDSVTSIGDYAFSDCSGLTSVTIPNSVTSIGEGAFSYCSGLTSVTIPNSVTNIGDSAFSGCSGLTNVTLPDSVTNVGGGAFLGCIGLADDDGFVIVRGRLYGYYGEGGSVVIPGEVKSIGDQAFYNCINVTSVMIPNSVTNIGGRAFLGCSGLANVAIGSGVTSIGGAAFAGCSGLTSVELPDSVTSIGFEAFSCCMNLTSVTIPDSVVDMGGGGYGAQTVFQGCDKLWTAWYRTLVKCSGMGEAVGGSSAGTTTIIQQVAAPYDLTESVADRSIASVTVNSNCAIDEFVLKNGKVYDCALRIVNTSDVPVKLSLPRGYEYETFRGAKPLTIPALSRNILTITRTTDNTFLVSRRQLETVE